MDHIFFIHSSVEGHLGSFHSLVTVAIAAINTGAQMALLFTTSVPLGDVHSSQSVERAEMPFNRRMDKEDVVHIYNGLLLSHQKG